MHDSLARIARDCGLTTASLSKSLLNLKDQLGIKLPVRKRHFTRRTFADKQRELLAAGEHSSQTRRKHKKTAK
jgi:DNA-binding transcriptional LysR family regulator